MPWVRAGISRLTYNERRRRLAFRPRALCLFVQEIPTNPAPEHLLAVGHRAALKVVKQIWKYGRGAYIRGN